MRLGAFFALAAKFLGKNVRGDEKKLYLCRHNLNYNAYELLRNGTTGTDERGGQRHLAGRP